MTTIAKSDLVPEQWSAGETFGYYIYPLEADYKKKDFLFRISSATIKQDTSFFTQFLHYNRYLVMLDTDLVIEQNGKGKLIAKQEVFYFSSEDFIKSYTKGADFNVMLHRSIINHRLVVDRSILLQPQGFVMVFALENTKVNTCSGNYTLQAADLLLIDLTIDPIKSLFCQNNAIIAQWVLP